MTKISGANGTSIPAGSTGMQQKTDAVSRDIQRQIANAQKQLQEISSNQGMSAEHKMKRRQEIQKQIADLSNQLRQHEMELRRQRQQEAAESAQNNSAGAADKTKEEGTQAAQTAGNLDTSMKAIISADSAMKLAQVHGSTAAEMKGRAAVLKREIKQDGALGGSSVMKHEELAEAEANRIKAQEAQADTLSEARNEVADANKNKAEETSQKTEEEKRREEEAGDLVREEASPTENGVGEAAYGAAVYKKIDISL